MSNHLSRLALDRVLARVAGEQEELHLRACAACAARLAVMQRDYGAFLAAHPTPEVLRPAPRAARHRPVGWPLALGGALAAAALILVTVRTIAPERPSTRAKGGSIVTLGVQRSGSALPYSEEQELRPGDVLAFRYSTQRRHLLLLSLERSGKINVYLTDRTRRRSMHIRPGRDLPLGLGVELDDYVGPERVIALLSDEPLEVEAVKQAVRQRLRTLTGEERRRLELGELPLEAEQLSWLIEKGGPR